jgi:hypothetical protein
MDFFQTALQYFLQDGFSHGLFREPDDIHGRERPAAHGVHIAEGVGRGDLPETVWVVDDGREKIQGLNQGQIVPNFIDTGIVRGFPPDQEVGTGFQGQVGQDLLQVARTQFGGSAGGPGGVDEIDCFLVVHMFFRGVLE